MAAGVGAASTSISTAGETAPALLELLVPSPLKIHIFKVHIS